MKRDQPSFFLFKIQILSILAICLMVVGVFHKDEMTQRDMGILADSVTELRADIARLGQLHQEMPEAEKLLAPVALLDATIGEGENAREGGGTAIAIMVKDGFTFFLTAEHVINNASNLKITMYGGEIIEDVEVVADSIAEDLALLKVKGEYPCAKLALREPQLYTRVIVVGCPLGAMPLPTEGLLVNKEAIGAPRTLWRYTAPTIFGNSGGAVYTADGKLIGISNTIKVIRMGFSVAPVCHLGGFTPLPTITDWLEIALPE